MAQTIGEAGRYATEKEGDLLRKILFFIMIMVMVVGVAFGFSRVYFGSWWPWLFVILEFALFYYGKGIIEKLISQREAWRAGGDGEREVAEYLDRLPQSYHVIHDIATDFGNLDHVVVCEKGIFAIETKRWKGTISSDKSGGLLLNNQKTSKNPVKTLAGTIMRIKERLEPLTQLPDIYIQGLLVFPISRVEARWGETGIAHCLSPDKLEYYFDKWYKPRTLLRPEEVKRIARGFLALARMEEGFVG